MVQHILKYSVIFVLFYFIFRYFNVVVDYDSSKDFFNNMLVVSTMVFTLMAIWIAYLYPDALDKIRDQEQLEIADFSEAKSKLKRLEFIVASVLKSAFVSIVIIALYLAKALFESTPNLRIIQEVGYLLAPTLITLFWLQSEAIFNVMKANVTFINELHTRKEHKEEDEDI